MGQVQPYRMLWQKRKDGGARLMRLYGAFPQVFLPQEADGHPLVEIAPYCFAAGPKGWHGDVEDTADGQPEDASCLQELHTNAIEELCLSDSVEKIGNCAFYNCRKLHTLCIGAKTADIGSDAFMNTLSFHKLNLRCGAGEKSGVRQILAQVSSDMEVRFISDAGTEASLLYPEYYESYDEVAPAHLFGRSILGEGFRARQCIRDGRVDFAGYDAVFLQAGAEEREETLSQMALGRLMYPYALHAKNREIYRECLTGHIREISGRFVRRKDFSGLRFLHRENLLYGAELAACAQAAAESGWAEGAAGLLGWMAKGRTASKKRYDFDDGFV